MPFTAGLCTNLQNSLYNVAGSNAGFLNRIRTGYLDSLLSSINTAGFDQIQVWNGNGGARGVEISYIPAASRAAIVTSPQNLCTGPTLEVEPRSQLIQYSTFSFAASPIMLFTESEMAKLCDPTQEMYRAQVMMAAINPLMDYIDRTLLTQATQVFGNPYNTTAGPYTYTPPVAPLTARLIKGADNSAFYQGWYADVDSRLQQMNIYQAPIAVGFGNIQGLNQYVRLNNIGCCNDIGIDLSRAADGSMYYFSDLNTDQILGQNQFFVYAPGAMQFVQFNKYTNLYNYNPQRKIVDNLYGNTTIIDPFTGLELDMKWSFDNCTDSWKMQLFTSYQLYALPADMYLNTDQRFGVRNSLRYQAIPA